MSRISCSKFARQVERWILRKNVIIHFSLRCSVAEISMDSSLRQYGASCGENAPPTSYFLRTRLADANLSISRQRYVGEKNPQTLFFSKSHDLNVPRASTRLSRHSVRHLAVDRSVNSSLESETAELREKVERHS